MYKIKTLSSSKLEIQFEIPKEEFENFWNEASKELAKNLNLKGFRQGNVPQEIAKQYINENDILNEAARLAIYENIGQIAEREGLEIIHAPEIQITKIAKLNPLEFKAICEIVPKFELKNYKKTKIKKQEIKIQDSEIEKTLIELQNMRASLKNADRPAKIDDVVNIDYKISIDNSIIKNGEGKNAEFILGQGGFIEGFEKGIENMSGGEEKKLILNIPENYYQKDIAGKTADIEIKLNQVKEKVLPEINDEFAKNIGKFETLNNLRNSVKEGIFIEKNHKEKERIRLEIINELIKEIKTELPDCLIKDEAQKLLEDFKNNIKSMSQIDFEEYLRRINKTEEEIKKDFAAEAEKRIKSYLALQKIAKMENINIDEEEVVKKADELLKQYSSAKETQDKIDIEHLLNYSRNTLLNDKVFEYLESIMVV